MYLPIISINENTLFIEVILAAFIDATQRNQKMMECTNCGAQLRPSARICIKCGQAVNREGLNQSENSPTAANNPEEISSSISQEASASTSTPESTQSTTAEPVFNQPISPSINLNSPQSITQELSANGPFTKTQKIIMITSTVIFILCLFAIV